MSARASSASVRAPSGSPSAASKAGLDEAGSAADSAGHRSMATTNQYVHLAGVVFRDEAEALERRLLGVSDQHGVGGDAQDCVLD